MAGRKITFEDIKEVAKLMDDKGIPKASEQIIKGVNNKKIARQITWHFRFLLLFKILLQAVYHLRLFLKKIYVNIVPKL